MRDVCQKNSLIDYKTLPSRDTFRCNMGGNLKTSQTSKQADCLMMRDVCHENSLIDYKTLPSRDTFRVTWEETFKTSKPPNRQIV
ncbi:hypothetical protein CEXT_12741 [Caerostris extrusa]|uniref:Uncharacterized protein n=1 Tax=Caerostris extrusa TaxID=172846 RepID=A0AAV4Y7F2_CAEEX|nr:hypothetical protein CEXT_12741 [Caerostris extrusa]